MLSDDNGSIGCLWQMADVARALRSVAKVAGPKACPGKQEVLLGKEVSVVVPQGTVIELLKIVEPVMRYERGANLYIAELSMTSFHRPGRGD